MDKLRIKIQGFLGGAHSWAIVNQSIGRELLKRGYNVDLVSTDGLAHLPSDLAPYVKPGPVGAYDLQVSYTAPVNWSSYLANGTKNRFGIWCSEYQGQLDKNNIRMPLLPIGFAKYHQNIDKILAPSQFAANIFIDAYVPKDKVVVIPHGINLEDFENKNKYPLKTNAPVKILANIAQIHLRKNLSGLLETYGKAFDKNDNICLIMKVNNKKPKQPFDQYFPDVFKDWTERYPNHAKVEIITEFIPNIIELYNACDIVFTMTNAEGFWMPGIEAFGANKLVIAPRYGGQLDFLNDDNSILIGGKEIRAKKEYQYWQQNVNAVMFQPDINEAVDRLKYVANNAKPLIEQFTPNMNEIIKKYTWENVCNQILGLME